MDRHSFGLPGPRPGQRTMGPRRQRSHRCDRARYAAISPYRATWLRQSSTSSRCSSRRPGWLWGGLRGGRRGRDRRGRVSWRGNPASRFLSSRRTPGSTAGTARTSPGGPRRSPGW